MSALKKIKKDKGFTLVEIIVVLVILAVLAAFTIPTMLGFVEEAKGKAYIAEAREVYVAAQATATEYVGNGVGVTAAQLSSKAVGTEYGRSAPSLTMKNYLSTDMAIGSADPPFAKWQVDQHDWVGWTVKLDGGKVTELVYYRYEYKVTIEVGGSTSVEKIGYRS